MFSGGMMLALGFAWSSAPGQEELHRATRAALAEQAFGEALELALSMDTAEDRARAATAVFAAAGDIPQALEEARRGLQLSPRQPELLWYATSCSLALRDARGARRHLDGLRAALDAGAVDAGESEAWEQAWSEFEPDVTRLESAELERVRAQQAARRVSLAGLGVLSLSILGLASGLKSTEGRREEHPPTDPRSSASG